MLNHGSNLLLQRAITKHGLHNFTFQILEFCDISELLTREQYYLDLLFSLPKKYRYNISPTAGLLWGLGAAKNTGTSCNIYKRVNKYLSHRLDLLSDLLILKQVLVLKRY